MFFECVLPMIKIAINFRSFPITFRFKGKLCEGSGTSLGAPEFFFSGAVAAMGDAAQAVSRGVRRLTPDPCIGVGDLMKAPKKWMKAQDNHDLNKLLTAPDGKAMDWKRAPDPRWLAQVADLFEEYCEVAPNGVLPSKKNKAALSKIGDSVKINFTKKSEEDFCDMIDDRVRMLFKHFRDLKTDPKKMTVFVRKAIRFGSKKKYI